MNLKPLEWSVTEGITRATFDREGFEQILRDNADASLPVVNERGDVIGILHTAPIQVEKP